jgi:cytidine deaminase
VTDPDRELLQRARHAGRAAYAHYSAFRVGAAVHAGGEIYTGCNIENASYGLSICAERVAVFAAIAAGARRIESLALACIDVRPSSSPDNLMPCGACLQVMAEFGTANMPVHVDQVRTFTLAELLPHAFTLAQK